MNRILFICWGNICRSTMAEFVMKDMVAKANLEKEIFVESAGTSTEELGNDTYIGTKKKLRQMGIDFAPRQARQMTKADYEEFDYLIGMEKLNLQHMKRIAGGDNGGKMACLMDYTDMPHAIADPWYTQDFDASFADVEEGCRALLQHIKSRM